jgi:hypothetical protein
VAGARVRCEIDLDHRPAPMPSQAVAADIYEDPLEPRLEARWITERAVAAPGHDHRVMGRVFGLNGVPEDHTRQSICAGQVEIRQLGEDFSAIRARRCSLPA